MTFTCAAILSQLDASGVRRYVLSLTEHEATGDDCAHVTGMIRPEALPYLLKHPKFKKAPAKLHANVGFPRVEFRSLGSAFGKDTSLQVVIGPRGSFYADLDRWNPLESVEGFALHNAIEVWIPKWLRRKKKDGVS